MGDRERDGDQLKEHPITLADVHAHVGLSTNVFPKMTDAAFAKKLHQALEGRVAREIKQLTSV
jgi:hypothetical protein